MSPVRNVNWLTPVRVAMDEVKRFWARIDIDIQPKFSAIEQAESILDYSNNDFIEMHYWTVRGGPLTIYVSSESTRVGPNLDLYGEAAPGNGTAMVAGGNSQPGGGNLMDEIINHEMGHLLGLEHKEDTFMRRNLDVADNVIDDDQRDTVREKAYESGGY